MFRNFTVAFVLVFSIVAIGCDGQSLNQVLTQDIVSNGADCYEGITLTENEYLIGLNKSCIDNLIGADSGRPPGLTEGTLLISDIDPIIHSNELILVFGYVVLKDQDGITITHALGDDPQDPTKKLTIVPHESNQKVINDFKKLKIGEPYLFSIKFLVLEDGTRGGIAFFPPLNYVNREEESHGPYTDLVGEFTIGDIKKNPLEFKNRTIILNSYVVHIGETFMVICDDGKYRPTFPLAQDPNYNILGMIGGLNKMDSDIKYKVGGKYKIRVNIFVITGLNIGEYHTHLILNTEGD